MSQGLINAVSYANVNNSSRRNFLKFGALLGTSVSGGLLLGIRFAEATPTSKMGQPYIDSETGATFKPNAFIEIDQTGQVMMTMSKVEMGQGVYTSIPMLLAEELEVELAKVKLLHAPPNDKLFADPMLGAQVTGGSTSIRTLWQPMREAGAVCRTLLISAAAKKWGVNPSSCYAKNGAVVHKETNKTLAYGTLVKMASTMPIPKDVVLKTSENFTIIGKPVHRLDTPDKANGLAKFGIDVSVPGMLYAIVASCPVFGGKLVSVDDSRASAMKDVVKVIKLENAVAVVGRHTWAAKRGLDSLSIVWDEGKNSQLSTDDLVQDLQKASKSSKSAEAANIGDTKKAFKSATKTIEAVYKQPFLAHATMEPMNCTVHVQKDGCDVWVGTQVPTFAQKMVAKEVGLPLDKVRIHNHLIGGGFGRRLEFDGIVLATKVAKQMNAPLKVTWTREEDIQHDMYRPYYYDVISAGLDANNKPVAWKHRIVGSSIMARFAPGAVKNGVDSDAVEVAMDPPYVLPNLYVDYVRLEPRDLPTAFWRGVGPTRGTYVVESFMDELAAAAKVDPIEYRLSLLDKTPRLKSALKLVAEKSGWNSKHINGRGLGTSAMHAFGSFLAMVADVTVNDNGEVKVNKVWCVVDCGMVVNPDTVKAQIEGGIIFGLTAALYGEITIKHGRVQQSNFNDYRMMRINESPEIEVHIVASAEAPGGIGEPGTAAVGAALNNAIYAATGKRLRQLPIGNQLKKS